MAPRNQRDNAVAFDELLGQLVDELALQPTMIPEPEPPPAPPPVAVAPVAYPPVPAYEPAPRRRDFMPLAVGGGIAVSGIAVALVLLLGGGDRQPSVTERAAIAARNIPAPVVQPAPPVAVVTPVQTPNLPVGAGLTGQPADPGALAQMVAPTVEPTPVVQASQPKKKKVVQKAAGPAKPKPSPAKPTVVDPFG